MKDPIRLREGGSSFESMLLVSAREDVAGKHVERRVKAAMGLGVVIGVTSTTSSAGAAGAATKSSAAIGGLAIAKWVTVVVVAGVAAGGATLYVRSSPANPATRVAFQASVPTPAPILAPTPAPILASTPAPVLASTSVAIPAPTSIPTPAVDPLLTRGQARSQGPVRTNPVTHGLAEELATLDRVNAALHSNQSDEALSLLNRHDIEFPEGLLAPESLALRIEIYAAKGDRSKVRELADRFLSRYPDHPQAAHVRALEESTP